MLTFKYAYTHTHMCTCVYVYVTAFTTMHTYRVYLVMCNICCIVHTEKYK